jgi:hypothetical protein
MLSHPMGEMRILSKEAGNKQIRAVRDRGVGRPSVWPAEGGKIGAEHDIQPKERRAGCRAPKCKGQRQRTEGLETVQCPCIFNRQSAYAVSTGCLTTNHWQDKSVGDANDEGYRQSHTNNANAINEHSHSVPLLCVPFIPSH